MNRRAAFIGCFDEHIRCSIPGFWEAQGFLGQSVVNFAREENDKPGGLLRNPLTFLDVGCTEGSFIKALSSLTPDGFYSVGIEPNTDCVDVFDNVLPSADRARCICAALPEEKEQFGLEAWRENHSTGEITVNFFDPEGKRFDFIQSAMTFQFMSENRDKQVGVCKEILKPSGILILQEKVRTDIYDVLETEKNDYKAYYFSEEANRRKAEFLAMSGGMEEKLASYKALETCLVSHFTYVVCYWRSGNFIGLIASDERDRADRILSYLPGANIAPFSSLTQTVMSE